MKVERHRTAILRHQLSRPVVLAMRDGVLKQGRSFFDFGCGHGQDVEYLSAMGFSASGWDPAHAPDCAKNSADVVNLGYVINVIEEPAERAAALREALGLAKLVLVVSAMVGFRDRALRGTEEFSDGVLTKRGTFQKYFEQAEFHEYVASATKREAYPAGLGVVYVFNDPNAELEYCTAMARESTPVGTSSAISSIRISTHDLEQIGEWVRCNRKLPEPQQLPPCGVALGLLGSSDDWLDRLSSVLSTEEARKLKRERRQVLLEKICSGFYSPRGGLRMSDLSFTERADVRSVFGSMDRANRQSEIALKALMDSSSIERLCREWGCGKITPNALYLHRTVLPKLPPELRILVYCAQEMAALNGALDANVIKINFRQVGVSFANYPNFEEMPHPRLAAAIRVDFETSALASRDYESCRSAPILHRKELLVSDDHPDRPLWAALTLQEHALGLLGRRDIGTEAAWGRLLATRGIRIEEYQVIQGESFLYQGTTDEAESPTDDDFEVPIPHNTKAAPKRMKSGRKPLWTDSDVRSLLEAVHRLGRSPLPHEVNVDEMTLKRFNRLEDWSALFGQGLCQETFEASRRQRWRHWIIQLAAARFTAAGRPKVRELDLSAQADLSNLFSSYRQACAEADQWLAKIGEPEEIAAGIASWPKGMHVPEKGVYFHASLLNKLPVVLRLVVLCAEFMAGRQMPEEVTVIRIAPGGQNVKFYHYEHFDRVGATRRISSTKVDFRRRRVDSRDHFKPERHLWARSKMFDLGDSRAEVLRDFENSMSENNSELLVE